MKERMRELLFMLDLNEIEIKIALQCAPVIFGIKIANILIIPTTNSVQTQELFVHSDLKLEFLFDYLDKSYYLLYQEEGLETYLHNEKVQTSMLCIGLKFNSLKEMIHQIACEYENCLRYHQRFPHEIGFLLGYPPEDVLGFIQENGKNYLYCGYWKVYGDLTMALEMFEAYNKVKELLLEYLNNGGHLHNFLGTR